jgi:hypothetical protein
MMKKRYWMATLAIALGVSSGTALAATISNLNGQSCPEGFTGTYHFVNNQIPAPNSPGTITATFDSGDTCITGPSKITQNTQHFLCVATGALTGASTNLGGRLQLSDFTCTATKPPPCDPKTEVCEPPPCDPKTQVCK